MSERESGVPYLIGPLPLRCTVCAHERFHSQGSQLTAAPIVSEGPVTDCLICARCGYVHWFVVRRDDTPWNVFTKRLPDMYEVRPADS